MKTSSTPEQEITWRVMGKLLEAQSIIFASQKEADLSLLNEKVIPPLHEALLVLGPRPTVIEQAGLMGGGEDATQHEWNFGHPYLGTNEACWRCPND